MQLVAYLDKDKFFPPSSFVKEVIVCLRDFSSRPVFAKEDLPDLYAEAQRRGQQLLLECDLLFNSEELERASAELLELESNTDCLRILDTGLARLLVEQIRSLQIDLMVNWGNHNSEGLLGWNEAFGSAIRRLILSPEISHSMLDGFIKKIPRQVEIPVLGALQVFYSRRLLLSEGKDDVQALASSEESAHKNFPFYQNKRGTFMDHVRDLGILDDVVNSFQGEQVWGRIDLRGRPSEVLWPLLERFWESRSAEDWLTFKEQYTRALFKGYFRQNKSSSLFRKLKNEHLEKQHDGFVGEVIDYTKKEYIVIKQPVWGHHLCEADWIEFLTPEGKKIGGRVRDLHKLNGHVLKDSEHENYFVMKAVKGAIVKSQLYFTKREEAPVVSSPS